MKKNEEATVVMLANSSDDQLSSPSFAPKMQLIVMMRLFVFGSVEFFLVMNTSNTCLLVGW